MEGRDFILDVETEEIKKWLYVITTLLNNIKGNNNE